jgi:3D (Asp-Asp-Asp) domain-containing protein
VFTKAISIDSRSRDTWENDNDFQINIERLKNVISIEIITAEITNSLYDITAANNILDFRINATLYSATVAAGTYTGTELATAITSAMFAQYTGVFPLDTIVVTYNEKTNFMIFTVTTHTMDLLAATGTDVATGMWPALGFAATDLTALAAGTAQSGDATTQLKTGENYLYIRLDNLGSISSSDTDDDIFAKVALDDLSTFREVMCIPKTYSKYSPLPSLSSLKVSLLRRDTSLYVLRTNPWSFTLQIKYIQ